MGCFRLLRVPWLYAVHGNHEDMLLDYAYQCVMPYAYNEAGDQLFRNGGRWVLDRGKSEQDELWDDLVPRVARLPYLLHVVEVQGCFHVAHAELLTGDFDSEHILNSLREGQDKAPPE